MLFKGGLQDVPITQFSDPPIGMSERFNLCISVLTYAPPCVPRVFRERNIVFPFS
jgi:hypothetical protein